jgi:cell division protein FtsQ
MRGAVATVAALPRISLERLAPTPRLRRRLLAAAVAVTALTAAYFLWFRDCGLVQVERVTVTGVTTRDAPRVRRALEAAARSMTTLHVDEGRLRRVVSSYPAVRGLEVSPDFPKTLRIRVVQYRPVAMAIAGRSHVALGGDGTVLRDLPVSGALPTLRLSGALPPGRVSARGPLVALRIMAAAPGPLLHRLSGVARQSRGLVVVMRKGPDLVFGDTSRLYDKWEAAARVLADPSARGADYIDLRLPERPAAGGLPGQTVTPLATASQPPAVSQQAQPAPGAARTGPAQISPPGAQAPPTGAPAGPATGQPAAPAAPPATQGGGATANPQP